MAAVLGDVELFNARGDIQRASDLLRDQTIVAFFFSAEWCPYCRELQPALNAFYDEVNAQSKRLEIIYVTSEDSAAAQSEHLRGKQGPWWAVPWEAPVRQELKRHYEIAARKELADLGMNDRKGGLPSLLVVDAATGRAIDYEGAAKVQELGAAAVDAWLQVANDT